jgi:hypothetical protein
VAGDLHQRLSPELHTVGSTATPQKRERVRAQNPTTQARVIHDGALFTATAPGSSLTIFTATAEISPPPLSSGDDAAGVSDASRAVGAAEKSNFRRLPDEIVEGDFFPTLPRRCPSEEGVFPMLTQRASPGPIIFPTLPERPAHEKRGGVGALRGGGNIR